MTCHLADYLETSARQHPDRIAVVDPSGTELTYRKLNDQANAVAAFLAARGVSRGDRVGVVLPKSAIAVATLFGIMKAGAAYVPVDYTAPPERAQAILTDCRVRALFIHSGLTDLATPLAPELVALVVVGESDTRPMASSSWADVVAIAAPDPDVVRSTEDLAYILYTSGSTGVPKGVILTHENASSFVEWCATTFQPTEQDRFSSHAPFHFDLSVLDLYVAIKHGAAVHLISEELGKNPRHLARFIADHRLTVWYSTPSILTLLLQFGGLDAQDCSALRIVFFAGEVFPVKHLRELINRWPHPVFYNLYGPTETNVCTYARIPAPIPEDRTTPYPIGYPCEHCNALVLDADHNEVSQGEEGLLYISGAPLFSGYWNRPVENAAAFIVRDGVRWYNTGDLVRWAPGEGYLYNGRKDRMVKRRGYRIELGEIERALYTHPRVREVAALAVPDADSGVRITAFVACAGGTTPSIVELKTFCGTRIPGYMTPDRFIVREMLPRTSTDKVDYQALKGQLAGVAVG